MVSWEKGTDRICDADILPEVESIGEYKSIGAMGSKVKQVELLDDWESFTMHFMMNYPQYDETMDFILDGNQLYFDFEAMSKFVKPSMWMPDKYGQEMKPWEATIRFPNTKGDNCGQF